MYEILEICYLKDIEKKHINKLLDALKAPYKNVIINKLEAAIVTNPGRTNRQALMSILIDIMLNAIDKLSKHAVRLQDDKGLSDYEKSKIAMLDALMIIINVDDPHVEPLAELLTQKILED